MFILEDKILNLFPHFFKCALRCIICGQKKGFANVLYGEIRIRSELKLSESIY